MQNNRVASDYNNTSVKCISIVMCTYNGEKYLHEQLDSIINQTYPIFEIIIQDDQSSDNTVEILQGYAKKYDFIKLYQNIERKGVNLNFFSAIAKASGDYIAISDQDDIWMLDKIENQINSIGDNWISFGFSKSFAENKEMYFDKRIPNYCIERIINISPVPGHTILIKKEFLALIPILSKYNFILYDHLFAITAAAYNKLSFCEQILVNYRQHQDSATYTQPVMDIKTRTIANISKSVFRTLSLYLELKPKIQTYYYNVYKLLLEFSDATEKNDAQQFALSRSQKGVRAFYNLIRICIKKRCYLFYIIEPDNLFTFMRALYFPISSSDYFRYMSKDYKK